jgi:hypothetical protein
MWMRGGLRPIFSGEKITTPFSNPVNNTVLSQDETLITTEEVDNESYKWPTNKKHEFLYTILLLGSLSVDPVTSLGYFVETLEITLKLAAYQHGIVQL